MLELLTPKTIASRAKIAVGILSEEQRDAFKRFQLTMKSLREEARRKEVVVTPSDGVALDWFNKLTKAQKVFEEKIMEAEKELHEIYHKDCLEEITDERWGRLDG